MIVFSLAGCVKGATVYGSFVQIQVVLLTTAFHTANEILDQILCFKTEDLFCETQCESLREVSYVYAGGVRLL